MPEASQADTSFQMNSKGKVATQGAWPTESCVDCRGPQNISLLGQEL